MSYRCTGVAPRSQEHSSQRLPGIACVPCCDRFVGMPWIGPGIKNHGSARAPWREFVFIAKPIALTLRHPRRHVYCCTPVMGMNYMPMCYGCVMAAYPAIGAPGADLQHPALLERLADGGSPCARWRCGELCRRYARVERRCRLDRSRLFKSRRFSFIIKPLPGVKTALGVGAPIIGNHSSQD